MFNDEKTPTADVPAANAERITYDAVCTCCDTYGDDPWCAACYPPDRTCEICNGPLSPARINLGLTVCSGQCSRLRGYAHLGGEQ